MKFRILLLSAFLAFFGVQSYAQACAAYGYFTQSGATVTFNDTSYSQYGHYTDWGFGDGTSASGSAVSHTYTSNGTYSVSMYIYDSTANCDDTTYFSVTVSSLSNCNASFTFALDSTTPYKYNFTYTGTGGTAWWSLPNGGNSNTQNVSYTFAGAGNYTMCLSVLDSSNNVCDSICQTITVAQSSSSCYGDFSYTVDSANPFKLNFNNTSVGSTSAYWWFGGSTYSSTYNPSHTFASAGYQTVCLTTYDSSNNICDSICKTVYVPGASSNCTADGYFYITDSTVSFFDSSYAANGYSIEWSFGDGGTSNALNPTNLYATNQYYTACLYIEDTITGCNDTTCWTIYIASPSSSSCNASFGYSIDSTSPYVVNFNNTSTGASSYTWLFTDASTTVTSTLTNPSFSYADPGYKMVCLTTFDSSGNVCDSTCQYIYIPDSNSVNCDASFTFSVDSMNMSASSYPVDFYSNTSGQNYSWNFGDGSTDTSASPSHIYTSAGTYTVCLNIVSGYDSLSLPIICDTFCTTVTVGSVSNCSPTMSFTIDSSNSNRYYFTGSTPPSGGYASWEIYEGSSNSYYNGQSVTHTFSGSSSNVSVYYSVYRADSTMCGYTGDTFALSGANCQASYYLAIDTNNLYNLYIVNNSTGTTSGTNYYWTFGDGSSSTAQYPTHQYATFGLYELCLTISDSASGCSSTHCDSIGLDSAGNLLKKDGFGITVVDDKDLTSVPEMDAIQGVTVYPNPSTGMYTVSVNMKASEELVVSAMNSVGQVVMSKEYNTLTGNNMLGFDMSNQPNGIYFLNLRTGNQVKNLRVYLQK